jgi:DNA mismatch repair protein MutL
MEQGNSSELQQIMLLEESVINKIAAGEVIERPASIVKELVENAIDAKSTQITVEVSEGGKSRIVVVDNGHGMSKDNARLCIQRHATSKILHAEDLFNIQTLGFRGEGLASIVAVAQVVLETKTKDEETGLRLVAHGGKAISEEEVGIPEGTSITVTNLFFNVPARKKHLKTIQTELRRITELMTKYAIAYPHKSFRLMHQGNELLFTPATDALSTLVILYGKKITDALIPVSFETGDIKVRGFIGKPTLTRADKSLQHIYVNKRPIQNYIITKAVGAAYHTLLHLERQPVFFLNVDIKPAIIDVNVHPQKTTIRIEKENELYNALFTAVRDALDQERLIPVVSEKSVQAPLLMKQFSVQEEKQTSFVDAQGILDSAVAKMSTENIDEQEEQKSPVQQEKPVAVVTPTVKGSEKISTLKLIGCIHNVFYIAENELGLVVIDQHAAHERVLFEQFMKQYYEGSIVVQELLEAVQMEFSPAEMLLLQENNETLSKLGFVFDAFGGNTMLLRSIPAIFGTHLPKEVVYDLLGQLSDAKNSIDTVKEEKIIRSSCRAAVKANDVVHKHQMKRILELLQTCKQPFTCPHGRPTMIQFSVPELERKFKRVV